MLELKNWHLLCLIYPEAEISGNIGNSLNIGKSRPAQNKWPEQEAFYRFHSVAFIWLLFSRKSFTENYDLFEVHFYFCLFVKFVTIYLSLNVSEEEYSSDFNLFACGKHAKDIHFICVLNQNGTSRGESSKPDMILNFILKVQQKCRKLRSED